MTNSPNPDNGSDPVVHSQLRLYIRRNIRRISLALGALAILGGAAGVGLRLFVYQRLVPIVERSMTTVIQRPVEIGAVERFSLTHVRFGESSIPPTATDSDQVDMAGIRARFNPLEVLWSRRLTLDVTILNPDATIEQDADGRWITTAIAQPEPGWIEFKLDTLRLEDGRAELVPRVPQHDSEEPSAGGEQNAASPRLVVEPFQADVTLRNDNRFVLFQIAGKTQGGGQFDIRGEADLEDGWRANLLAQVSQISLPEVSSVLPPVPIQIQDGVLGGNIGVEILGDRSVRLRGTAQFSEVAANIRNVPNRFTDGQGRLRFDGQRVELEDTTLRYGDIPVAAEGGVHLNDGFDITATVASVTAAELFNTFGIDRPVSVEGEFQADIRLTGALNQPQISGNATNRTPVLVDRIALADTSVQFSLTPQRIVLEALEVIPQTGGRITGSGRAQFGKDGGLVVDLQAQNLNGDAIAQRYGTIPAGYTLGSLAAEIQIFGAFDNIQALINWRAPQATFSGQGELLYTDNILRLRNTTLNVAGGTVSAIGQANLAQNRWQATVSGSQIQLSQFAPNLSGVGGGELRLAGRLDTLNPSQITADGQVTASQIPYLDESLTASIRWTGDRLDVIQANSPSLTARGTINARPSPTGLPEITTLNLNVRLRNYDLARVDPLPFTPPIPIDFAGQVDFAGQITGTLTVPQLAGRVQLSNLAVNDLIFDSPLTGTAQFAANEGLALDVSGDQDRLAVVLDDDYRPVSFFVQQDTAIAQGQREGDRLLTSIENFPLEALNLEPAANLGLGELAGLATGRFDINIADLSDLSGTGEVAIAQPRLGYISGDAFRGQFRYADGVITLNGSELRLEDSRYTVFGSLVPIGDIQFRGQVIAEEGNIEDLLVALQYFEITDFVRLLAPPAYDQAADVETIPVDTPDRSLFNQLRRYSEILALYEEQVAEREDASLLPDLAELKGEFSGTINIAFSQQDGLLAEFDLQGQDWQWGDYAEPNQIVAQGSFDGNTLTFLPFRFVADDTLINFSGQVGGGVENSGQLLAENVSVALLTDLLRLPIDIEGNLNANAVLTGSIENPQARGEIILTNATINDNPIAEADSTFSYSGARLNVIATMLVEDEPEDEDDPLRLTASIPYQFPFMTVSPQSDNIILDVDIRNEGLALLNLVNRAIAWEGGQADVTLQVRGTLRQTPTGIDLRPLATGVAEFDNGIFSAQVLPEPLTNVTGRVLFNRDRIVVETLQGQFSDGQVMAQGVIPIFLPLNVADAEPPQPLTVTLAGIELNLKGLYNGGVNGAIAINGTALAPQLTGEVILSDGRISLPDQAVAAATQTSFADFGGLVSPPQFNDLEITLGNNLLLTRAPILNFVASGNLFINGTLDDIRPAGTIRLRSGQVNVFTSQFNLDRTHTNIAEFVPNRGLDPILDIQLVTSVLEETRSPVVSTSPFTTSEIADISAFDFGEVQTVRVEASVMGPASELFSNIELRSSPPRSQNEIIALLGGGFVDTLGRGDSALAIANLAGSALLTGLQTLLSNALGISDFRLFPTTVIDDDRERGSTDQATASLALAAELGFDITSDLSFSILQLLTVEEPTQFNIRYRLNDQFLLRGTTNFSDDTRAVLEYEIRF
ncbi:MAG: translocation/assembly module TamB domain-containing protein [Elainellaceae cyanobacterium]